MPYKIKTEQFEGPLELLLELIEKEKLDITQVSLARIADEYLEHIGSRGNISLNNLSDFLWVASRLILIKSKALIPLMQLTDEEEEEIFDLQWQLAEYKKFKEASVKIGQMANNGKFGVSRESLLGVKVVFHPPKDIEANDLKQVFQEVLSGITVVKEYEEKVMDEIMSLEEKIADLQKVITKKIETSFSEVISKTTDKVEVIVSFLAMLEMTKQRIISVEQGDLFGEIKLKSGS